MLRTLHPDELSAVRGRISGLPDHAPTVDRIRSTVERIEAAHPELRIDEPVHVLVGSANCRASARIRPHVCTTAPNSSFVRAGDAFLSRPELALVQEAARLQSETALIELVWEACGTYRTQRTGMPSAYDTTPLTSVRALREYVNRNPSLRGAQKIARILPLLADASASARETKEALVIGMPRARGGYGLGIPRMNFEVAASPAARAISGRGSFRCDLCWPEAKLDVEYQSREAHSGEASRIRDSRRANALATMGWTVIGVTGDELDSLAAMDVIAETIRRHLGKRRRDDVKGYHARKLRLRRQLGLPVGYE